MTEEIKENRAEMGPDCRDLQDLPDLLDRSSTRTQAASTVSTVPSDLREDLVFLVRLDFQAQLDLKESVESPVYLDTVRRERRGSQGWWWDLMEACSDWRDSAEQRATEEQWDHLDPLVRTVLRA